MYSDTKKMQLIEDVLRENDNKVLKEIEAVLKQSRNPSHKKKTSAVEFLGLWSKEDYDLINKTIIEGCEQIHPNDWK